MLLQSNTKKIEKQDKRAYFSSSILYFSIFLSSLVVAIVPNIAGVLPIPGWIFLWNTARGGSALPWLQPVLSWKVGSYDLLQ